jgi:tetratricopeptide (TPR) repeat protein
MIVKNEAENLINCLNSVSDLVNEAIIVDTGSTDPTKQIANDWGAKVYDYHWQDDFAQARNFALAKVSGEWILVLDGDEVLVTETIPALKKVIADNDNLVINLIRQEIGAVSSPYSQVSRLFRYHPEIKFTRPYHALIDDHVLALQKKEPHWQIIDFPTIAIQHYGYQPEIIQSKDKTQRAKQAMESYLAKHPHDAYVCSKLGSLYLQLGETNKGFKLLKTGLKSNPRNPAILFELHYHLANGFVKQGQADKAVKHYQKAIAQSLLDKLKLGAYHNFGSLCYQVQDYESALQLWEQCLKIDPQFALAYYNLGLTYRAMGRTFKAISAYQQTIKLNPDYPWAYQNLAILLLKQGQIEDSAKAFQKAISLHQRQNPQIAQRLMAELKEMGLNLDFSREQKQEIDN